MQKPTRLLHSILISSQSWESIGMDFIGLFPKLKGFNYLWVVIYQLISIVYLVSIMITIKVSKLAWIFENEIIYLYKLPNTIVSNCNSKFISKFWKEVYWIIEVNLPILITFHLQTDSVTEWATQSIEQILQGLSDVEPNWLDKQDTYNWICNKLDLQCYNGICTVWTQWQLAANNKKEHYHTNILEKSRGHKCLQTSSRSDDSSIVSSWLLCLCSIQ